MRTNRSAEQIEAAKSIGLAIKQCANEAGWNDCRLSREALTSENTVRRWWGKGYTPRGDTLELLRHRLPGLAERLNARLAA